MTQAANDIQEPFDLSSTATDIISDSVDQAQEETLRGFDDIGEIVDGFSRKVRSAKSTNNKTALTKLKEFGMSLLKTVLGFIKKAVEIAVFKFVLELCAMVIKNIMESIAGKSGQSIEISTPNVFYNHGNNRPAYQAQIPNQHGGSVQQVPLPVGANPYTGGQPLNQNQFPW